MQSNRTAYNYDFSLVIATLNRSEELSRLLNSVNRQNLRCEVLIIDQSDEEFYEKNIKIIDKYHMPISHFRSSVRNTSHARNIGIVHSQGKVICFPDDDCEYPAGLLLRVLNLMNSGKNLLSGQYTDWEGQRTYFPEKAVSLDDRDIFGKLSAITFFINNQFEENIYFDERLGGGSLLQWSEEIDYGIRYIAKFGSAHYYPELIVFHKVKRASLESSRAKISGSEGYILIKNITALKFKGWIRLFRLIYKSIIFFNTQAAKAVRYGISEALRLRFTSIGKRGKRHRIENAK